MAASEQHTARSLFTLQPNPPPDTSTQQPWELAVSVTGVNPPPTSTLERIQHWHNHRPPRQSLNGTVLLFYKYCRISQPQQLLEWQTKLCKLLRIRGRLHVGAEGLNGTLGGSQEAVQLYIEALQTHCVWAHYFADTDIKTSPGGHHCFPNLYVRLCTEICQMNASPELIHWDDCCQHLTPTEFHAQVQQHVGCAAPGSPGSEKNDTHSNTAILLDVRNLYESEVGHFDNAVCLPTRHFTDFPAVADQLIEQLNLRDKKVFMYCTGGIRCERASAYLRSKGVQECFQLQGGIHNYVEELGAASLFRGKNFVFDRRLTTERVGTTQPMGKCVVCQALHDEYNKNISCSGCSCLVLLCDGCCDVCMVDQKLNKELLCGMCAALEDT